MGEVKLTIRHKRVLRALERFTGVCGVVFMLGTAIAIISVVALIWTESVVAGKAAMTSSFLAICGLVAGFVSMPGKREERP